MLEPGKTIGKKFLIEQELGSGAMGSVYKVSDVETDKIYAIKIIAMGLTGNDQALARFEREAEILKQLKHPNIVRFYGVGQYKKVPYLLMEFVEGETLDNLLERRGRLPWEEVVGLGKQLAAALQHAHEKGIIHRDLKPSNLMLLYDGTLKLADFGIAKDTDVTALTGQNSTVGTAAYMSPEQCKGERNLTAKSDLYSLGVVFYELLTGEKPFVRDSPVDMFMAHVSEPFERPSRKVLDIPQWLDTLVCQLMDKKPEHRPLDAAMVARALEEVAEKVAEQRSAGLEMATARAVDRPMPLNVDEADREAARSLRSAATKKKIRKRVVPFYERGWFLAVSLPVALAVFAGVFYWGFSAPSAANYYQRIVAVRKAGNTERERALLREYVVAYPTLNDANGLALQERHRELEIEQIDRAMQNRVNVRMKADDDLQKTAMIALKHEAGGDREAGGDLVAAQQSWADLIEKATAAKSPDSLVYIWLANRKQADLESLPKLERDLLDLKPTNDPERAIVIAVRLEAFEDYSAAYDRYTRFVEEYRKEFDQRRYTVLAAVHARMLKPRAESSDSAAREGRVKMVRAKLERVDLALQENVPASLKMAVGILKDVVELYRDDPDPELKKLVVWAVNRQKDLKP